MSTERKFPFVMETFFHYHPLSIQIDHFIIYPLHQPFVERVEIDLCRFSLACPRQELITAVGINWLRAAVAQEWIPYMTTVIRGYSLSPQ